MSGMTYIPLIPHLTHFHFDEKTGKLQVLDAMDDCVFIEYQGRPGVVPQGVFVRDRKIVRAVYDDK